MNPPDDDHLPSRAWGPPPTPAVPPAEPWDEPIDPGPAAARPFSLKVVGRALRRYWWQILLLWVVGSAGALALAYTKIKTSYVATAWLIVRSSAPRIFGESGSQGGDFLRFQKTQVELVTSPDVLVAALAKHPDLARLPRLAGSDDAEAAIRAALNVQIRVDTNLFTVSMTSEDGAEARQVVDAVVEAYLAEANDWADQQALGQVERLREEALKRQGDIERGEAKLKEMVGNLGTVDTAALLDRERMSLERFSNFLRARDQATLERVQLEGQLQAARRLAEATDVPPARAPRDEVEREFRNVPAVANLLAEKARAEQVYERHRRTIKQGGDPALAAARRQVQELTARLDDLRRELVPQIERHLARQAQGGDSSREVVRELEAGLAAARGREERMQELIESMKVQNEQQSDGRKALDVRLIEEERERSKALLQTIESYINQVEFEQKLPSQIDRANDRTQVIAGAGKRARVMAAAPFGVLGALLALFVLLEARSGRVADPDELSSRVRVEVMGVVPPLPSLGKARALPMPGSRGEVRARRRLDEFVQSLDHLRVALCAGRQAGDRRCVMITSACSGEGKTTLTAHLAGRCANAGLSTLLIDGDLRNPSLSRLLKVPDGPGLSDVLRGEVSAEAALTVIEAGGGFHLLPAGTPGFDPSRMLQGDRLGQMIGQFRQAFDIILIDTPPVLLVADALTLGRWADGALLAVRHDTSRFPLVERAHRRLAAVGVPVFGAVVNGARTMDAAYGYGYGQGYSYSYSQPAAPSGPTA